MGAMNLVLRHSEPSTLNADYKTSPMIPCFVRARVPPYSAPVILGSDETVRASRTQATLMALLVAPATHAPSYTRDRKAVDRMWVLGAIWKVAVATTSGVESDGRQGKNKKQKRKAEHC